MSDHRYAASMETIWTLWPTRHESGINRAILRHALRYARAWRKFENKFGAGRGSDTEGVGARNTHPTSRAATSQQEPKA